MGRTRVGRFAAITVPAAVASAGLGVAIMQGMVGAALSSANGFELQSDTLQAKAVAMGTGAIQAADAEEVVFADVNDAHLNGMCVGAKQGFGGIGGALLSALGVNGSGLALQIDSADPDVKLPDVSLNAKELAAGAGTTMGVTNIGVAQSEIENDAAVAGNLVNLREGNAGYSANDFGLAAYDSTAGYTVDGPDADAIPDSGYVSDNKLNDLSATSYAITLQGLALNDLKVTPHLIPKDDAGTGGVDEAAEFSACG
ncbi:MAG TPA: hypothetical protein VGE38_09240 [Nocardioides sp.]|uniref:hypothetical protein n=1 Tax=Nocardioides sp. TaxID=35761 RepID=UPI002EDB371C